MGIVEKTIFFTIILITTISSLVLLGKLSDSFGVEVPVSGGTVKEGVVGFPRYINPLLPVTDAGRDLSELIYSGLFMAESGGNITPDLAEGVLLSEDGLTYTVTLKSDIYFHDETPVTAYDVEFTVKKALDPILKSPKAVNWEGVSVKALSSSQIEFTLKKPYAPFLENLTLGILPQHIWNTIDSDAFLFSQLNFEPIGSGPYKIKEIKRDASGLPEYYHLVPFEKYTLGKAYIEDFYIKFYTPEKIMGALENGEIDFVSSPSPQKASEIKRKDLEVLRTPLPRIFAAFFNQNESLALAEKEVRVALDTAIDRQALINKVLYGFGAVANSPLPPSLSSLENVSGEQKTQEERIALAKQILEKAGWTLNSEGIYTKKTKTGSMLLEFSISTSNLPELKEAAEFLATTWKQLGVSTDVKVFERNDLQQNIIRNRKYQVLLFGEVIGRDLDLYAFWHSSERNDPGLNLSLYTNSKVDKLLSDARAETDEAQKQKIVSSIEQEIIKDTPALFLYSPEFLYIKPKVIKGVDIKGLTSTSERFINVKQWYQKTDMLWHWFKK
jgi:peptide/nickel transport system substrate-binding protein